MASYDRIEKRATLRAPVSRVWRAIADAQEFGRWFGVKLEGQFAPGKTITGTFDGTLDEAAIVEFQKSRGLAPSKVKMPEKNAVFCTVERVEPEHYSLELFVTENSDPARMERFLVRARELVPLEEVYVIPVPAGGQYRLWVVFGEFASRDEALAAGRRLPPRYQQAFRAAPRSFEELRGQL